MTLSATTWVMIVSTVLAAAVGRAGVTCWRRLHPQPLAAQIIYGSGDEVRVGVEAAGRLAESRPAECETVGAGALLTHIVATDRCPAAAG